MQVTSPNSPKHKPNHIKPNPIKEMKFTPSLKKLKTKRSKHAHTQHKLYMVALGHLQETARQLKKTIKAVAQASGVGGQVLRRGTPGAFGWFRPDLRPSKCAPRDRRCKDGQILCGGNSRNRRFARRHPQHFAPVAAMESGLV